MKIRNQEIKGIRKTAGECRGISWGFHYGIYFDRDEKKVFTGDLLSQNWWEEFHNPAIIQIGKAYSGYTTTMKDIIEMLENEIDNNFWETGKWENEE